MVYFFRIISTVAEGMRDEITAPKFFHGVSEFPIKRLRCVTEPNTPKSPQKERKNHRTENNSLRFPFSFIFNRYIQ